MAREERVFWNNHGFLLTLVTEVTGVGIWDNTHPRKVDAEVDLIEAPVGEFLAFRARRSAGGKPAQGTVRFSMRGVPEIVLTNADLPFRSNFATAVDFSPTAEPLRFRQSWSRD